MQRINDDYTLSTTINRFDTYVTGWDEYFCLRSLAFLKLPSGAGKSVVFY